MKRKSFEDGPQAPTPKAKEETVQRKAEIIRVAEDGNFPGSIIIETEGGAYALRRDSQGKIGGSKINYNQDCSVGITQELNEADLAELERSGVFKAFEEALAQEVLPERVMITEITKGLDDFDGSIIIKTKNSRGEIVGYALRKNSQKEVEGSAIHFGKNGEKGPVYPLHGTDFAKLAQNGVLKAFEEALAQEAGN